MINHHVIIDTYYSVRQSLKNHKSFDISWAYSINNVLPEDVLNNLNKYYDLDAESKLEIQGSPLQDSGVVEVTEESCGGDMTMEDFPRKSLIWAPDTILEEIHQSFDMLSDTVSLIWNRQLKLHSVNFWEDKPGFTMKPHYDSPPASATIQIYINDNNESAGTEFYAINGDLTHKVPWIKNNGYILDNNPTSLHGVSIPSQNLRRSLYVIYQEC